MHRQQGQVKGGTGEERLRQKAVVHCPLVQKNPTEVEGTVQIGQRMGGQKGQAEKELWCEFGFENGEEGR